MVKPHIQSIVNAAQARGIPVTLDDTNEELLLGNGRYRQRFSQLATSRTSLIAAKIAKNKHLTNLVLRKAGLPVPQSYVVTSEDDAARSAARTGYPVVLKPVSGNKGRHVFTGITNEADLRRLYALVSGTHRSRVQIEQHIHGNDYRILVMGQRTVAALEKTTASVIGDGRRTIIELIEEFNANPLRGTGRGIALRQIEIDDQTTEVLASQNLTVNSVPPPDLIVTIKPVSNVSAGGSTIDRTDEIHPDNATVAAMASAAVGLDIAGIDLVLPDISKSIWSTGGSIIEVNSGAGFIDHLQPSAGTPRDVGAAVLTELFPPGEPCKIPVVVVLKSPWSRDICQELDNALKSLGFTTGIATESGIEIASMPFGTHDPAIIFDNPLTEIAILEVAADQVSEKGNSPPYCTVCLVDTLAGISADDGRPVESKALRFLQPELVTVLSAEAWTALSEFEHLPDHPTVIDLATRAVSISATSNTITNFSVQGLNGANALFVDDKSLISRLPSERSATDVDLIAMVIATVIALEVQPDQIRHMISLQIQ